MREDLELDTEISTDIDSIIDEYLDNYISRSTYRGSPFYIIYDKEGLMKELDFDSYDDMEEYLTEVLGDSWGYEGEWGECYNCGEAIWLEDYYSQDYWIDYEGSGYYCGNCVRNVPSIRELYLDYLANNEDACNTFLSEQQLEEEGLIRLGDEYEYGYYGRTDSPHKILDELMSKYPNGRFIFDLVTGYGGFSTKYCVWAFPGYEEGAVDDEE